MQKRIAEFLTAGAHAEYVARMGKAIAQDEKPESLRRVENELHQAVIRTRDADPDRLLVLFVASYLCEMHAGLVHTQNGKAAAYTLRLPSKPSEYDQKWMYDFEKNTWIIPPVEPSTSRYGENGYRDYYGDYRFDRHKYDMAMRERDAILKKLQDDCKAKTGQDQWGYRFDVNRMHARVEEQRLHEIMMRTGMSDAVMQIANIAGAIRELRPERQHERELFFAIAEIHLHNLLELAQTFVRQARAKSLDEWQINKLDALFETYAWQLQSVTYPFKGVSGAYGLSLLNTGVDILRDLQIFLKGQLQEIRRTQMMERIAASLEGIQREVGEAVSVLRDIRTASHRTNALLEEVADRQARDSWIQHAQLKALYALGMVVSSTKFSSTTHSESFGLFGGSSTTTHTSAGPSISFGSALKQIEQQSQRFIAP